MVRTATPLSWAMHSELRLGEAGDPRAALLAMVNAGVAVSLSTDATSLGPVDLFHAMHVTWYGHASSLVEMDGGRVLFDPVWSARCSPSRLIGPRRLHPPPVSLQRLR